MLKLKLLLKQSRHSLRSARSLTFSFSKPFHVRLKPVAVNIQNRGKVLFSDKMLIYTNTGISMVLSIVGDLLQQNYNSKKENGHDFWNKTRTAQMAASGLAVGPFVHYWYLFLDRWFPGRNIAAVVKKIALDQLVLSPVYIALFLVTIGVLQGQDMKSMSSEFKDTGVAMLVSDLIVWTPAQTVNFFFLPTRFRVLFDNCVSLAMDVWYSYLRFDRDIHKSDDGDEL